MTGAGYQLIRRNKIARLHAGAVPRALEICSGCGGLLLGLKTTGFELSAHIEVDPEAAASYALNFGGEARPPGMESCSASQLVSDLGFATSAAESFDVLAAGLPCQAFARIGRSKLRSVAGQDDAFQKDPRAALYRRFLQYVEDTQPLVIIIENVPDILNFGGHNVPEEICETLEEAGYRTGYTILNAAYFGVPQVRERLFIVALANELGEAPKFPAPRIKAHVVAPSVIRKRKLTDILAYRELEDGTSTYGTTMRTWPDFETKDGTDEHLVRLTPRDFPIFAKMNHGADYPQARQVAEKLFAEALVATGMTRARKDSKAYRDLRTGIILPYDPDKFPNMWWKLDPSKPSRTAHMGKDTYSHIHYDSMQRRAISVREAARLQSFPDGFVFARAMNAAFRQIGNAVPPLLSLAVAKVLRSQLSGSARTKKGATDRRAA